ncbi:MAG: hypothetical protein AAFR46_10850 [Pseudomonadota bacterium]
MRAFWLAAITASLVFAGSAARAHFVTMATWPEQEAEQTALIEVLSKISKADGMMVSVREMNARRDAVSMVAMAGLEFTVMELAAAQAAFRGEGPFATRPAPELRLIAVIDGMAVLGSDMIRFGMDAHLALLLRDALGKTGHVPPILQGKTLPDMVPGNTGIPYARGALKVWRAEGLLR